MKARPGFSLAELLLAVMIFSFVATSLATIYSTSNRHMFQNYRANILKTNVGIAMKAVHNTLAVATRIDIPLYGEAGNVLAFATNVDQLTGCFPVGPGAAAWHYFCVAPDPNTPGLDALFYHFGAIPGGTGCASASPSTWGGAYSVSCGVSGGSIVMLMTGARPNPVFFSRRSSETKSLGGAMVTIPGVTEGDQVLVMLRAFWSASDRNFGRSQRDIDFMLDSVVQVQRYAR